MTLTAGVYVTNLTGMPLAMQLQGAACELDLPALESARAAALRGEGGAAAGPAARPQQEPCLLPSTEPSAEGADPACAAAVAAGGGAAPPPAMPGCPPPPPSLPLAGDATLPLLHLWGCFGTVGGGQGSARHARQSSWGASDLFRTFAGGSASRPADGAALVPTPLPPAAPAGVPGPPALRLAIPAAAAEDSDPDLLPTPLTPATPGLQPSAPGPALAGGTAATLGGWSTAVNMFRPVERRRVYLQVWRLTSARVSEQSVLAPWRASHTCSHLSRLPLFTLPHCTNRAQMALL